MQKETHIQPMLDAVKQIGDLFLQEYKKRHVPQNRPDFLAQLEAIDKRCLTHLKEQLNPLFPEIPWVGDEFDFEQQKKPLDLPQYWLCDAMDGYIQYIQQLPGWTIALTLIREGRPHLAVIYDPLAQELFWAQEGAGAFLNGARIRPSTKTDLKDMVAVFEYRHHDSNEDGIYQKIGTSVGELLEQFGVVRNYGPHSLQLAYVAAGRIDLFHQQDLDTYNWLAGVLIAQEAGAEIFTTDGRLWSWGEASLLVATPGASSMFLEAVRKGTLINQEGKTR